MYLKQGFFNKQMNGVRFDVVLKGNIETIKKPTMYIVDASVSTLLRLIAGICQK